MDSHVISPQPCFLGKMKNKNEKNGGVRGNGGKKCQKGTGFPEQRL